MVPTSIELRLRRAQDAQQDVVGREPRGDDHVDGLVVRTRERQVEVLPGEVAEGGVRGGSVRSREVLDGEGHRLAQPG